MVSLRKYFWQFVSVLLAIFAIFATYNVFFLGKPNKDLQIVVSTPVSLVEIQPEAAQDIQVFYKDEPVDKIFLLQINIVNGGNQPIAETDYSRPLSFSFSSKYKLADVTIASSQPTNIGMTITKTSEQSAEVSNTLLNPGDEVLVNFILVGDSIDTLPDFAIDGRILGVKEIQKVTPKESTPEWIIALVGTLSGAILTFLIEVLKEKIAILFRKDKKESIKAG